MRNRGWLAGVIITAFLAVIVLYVSMNWNSELSGSGNGKVSPTPTNAVPAYWKNQEPSPVPNTPTPTSGVASYITETLTMPVGERGEELVAELYFPAETYSGNLNLYAIPKQEEYTGWDSIYRLPVGMVGGRILYGTTELLSVESKISELGRDYSFFFDGEPGYRDFLPEYYDEPIPVAETGDFRILMREDLLCLVFDTIPMIEVNLKEGEIHIALDNGGQVRETCYYTNETGLDEICVFESETISFGVSRETRQPVWVLHWFYNGEDEYCLEGPTQANGEPVILYQGEHGSFPKRSFFSDNVESFVTLAEEAVKRAKTPKAEWEEQVVETLLAESEYGIFRMETEICACFDGSPEGKPVPRAVAHNICFDNPAWHLYFRDQVRDRESWLCRTEETIYISPEEGKIVNATVESYSVNEMLSHTRAVIRDQGKLVWLWKESHVFYENGINIQKREYLDGIYYPKGLQETLTLTDTQLDSEMRLRPDGSVWYTQYVYMQGELSAVEYSVNRVLRKKIRYTFDETKQVVSTDVETYDEDGNMISSTRYDEMKLPETGWGM